MAFTPLVPVTLNPTIIQTLPQAWVTPVVNSLTGTPINFSGWFSFEAFLGPTNATPNTADVTFGTVTGASTGILTLETSATDLENATPGTAYLRIVGKTLTGDANQLLATGVVNLQGA